MPTDLPLELLRIILRDVVHIRGALEAVMTTQFEWFEWRYNEDQKYAESLVNRLSLVRVCKAWYPAALELLYEDIRPKSFEKMESLRVSLEESAQSGSHLGLGWWTKRLDLPRTTIVDPLLDPLTSHFPNLRILRFPNPHMRSVSYGFRNSLPELRYMHLEPDGRVQIPTNLDTLSLILSMPYQYTFSNLTTLEIHFNTDDTSVLKSFSFPKIRHLTVIKYEIGGFSEIATFLNRYGQQLLSLCIDSDYLCRYVEELLCKTPNLRELIFALPVPDDQTHCNTFPSVTHVGLMGNVSWPDLADEFCTISRFPNLKCIRMVDNVFSNLDTPTSTNFRIWYHQDRQAGVRYEDADGNLLTDVIDKYVKL